MKLIDLNILLYAINEDAAHHDSVLAWWEEAINGDEPLGLPWIVLLGFLRIATNPDVFPRPLDPETAIDTIEVGCLLRAHASCARRTSTGTFSGRFSPRRAPRPTWSLTPTWRRSRSVTGPSSHPAIMTSLGFGDSAGRTRWAIGCCVPQRRKDSLQTLIWRDSCGSLHLKSFSSI